MLCTIFIFGTFVGLKLFPNNSAEKHQPFGNIEVSDDLAMVIFEGVGG